MEPIPCQVEYTDGAMAKAAGLHFHHSLGKHWRNTRILGWLAISSGIWLLREEIWYLSALLIAGGIIALWIKRIFIRRCIRSGRQSPYYGETQTWTLLDKLVQIERPGQQSKLPLSQIIALKWNEDGMILYTDRSTFFWLPKSGYPSVQAYHEARSHLMNVTAGHA